MNNRLLYTILKILLALSVSVYYYLNLNNNKFEVSFDINILEANNIYNGELVYSFGKLYDNIGSQQIQYKKVENEFQAVSLIIKDKKNISNIRIDPLINKGSVKIKNFIIKYKNQTRTINFKKILFKNAHNVIAKDISDGSIIFECIGNDPYIWLANDLSFDTLEISILFNILVLTSILYLVIEVVLKLCNKFTFNHIMLFSILFFYSIFAIFFSTWQLAEVLLQYFILLGILLAIKNDYLLSIKYIRIIFPFLAIYLILSYISVYYGIMGNKEYLNQKVLYICMAVIIPIGFFKIKDFRLNFFKVLMGVLFIFMSVFIVLLDKELLSINGLKLFNFNLDWNQWTQKNYIFWYVLFTYSLISFFNIKNKQELIKITIIISIASVVVLNSYSQSAKLAYFSALLIYIIFSLNKNFNFVKIFIIAIILLLVCSPFILANIDLTSIIYKLKARDAIYNTAYMLIKENPIFGYGFGSTLSIKLKEFIDFNEAIRPFFKVFRGGHPHSIFLLFWLEFGILGALFIGYTFLKIYIYIASQTFNYINHAALIAMCVAFTIIISFSWSIWYPQILLTYSFFGVLLMLSLNIKQKRFN